MMRVIRRVLSRFLEWRAKRVRAIGRDTYVRLTPFFGFGVRVGARRVRFDFRRGLQAMREIRPGYWIVVR